MFVFIYIYTRLSENPHFPGLPILDLEVRANVGCEQKWAQQMRLVDIGWFHGWVFEWIMVFEMQGN